MMLLFLTAACCRARHIQSAFDCCWRFREQEINAIPAMSATRNDKIGPPLSFLDFASAAQGSPPIILSHCPCDFEDKVSHRPARL